MLRILFLTLFISGIANALTLGDRPDYRFIQEKLEDLKRQLHLKQINIAHKTQASMRLNDVKLLLVSLENHQVYRDDRSDEDQQLAKAQGELLKIEQLIQKGEAAYQAKKKNRPF